MSEHSNGTEPEGPQRELSEVAQRLRKHVEEFEADLSKKRAERADLVREHNEKLARLDGDIELLENAVAALTGRAAPKLKAIRPKKTQPRRVGIITGSGTPTGFGVSLEVAIVAANALKQMVVEREQRGESTKFTQREFYRYPALDWDQAKGSQCVRYLRSISFLRKAGRDPKSGAELWEIMDADAIDREVAAAERRTAEYERGMVERARSGASPRELMIDCLREVGEVKGWAELARRTGITNGTIHAVGKTLESERVIVVDRPETSGVPVTIKLGEEA